MFRTLLNNLVGPRVPESEPARRRWRYAIPTLLLVVAASVLLASYSQPYWRMTLFAPQYPGGLHVSAFLNRLEGDVHEIDNLNHYIGMRPLEEAAQLERETSLMLIVAMGSLVLAAIFIHTRWAAALALPALLFPAGFLLDLWFWLHNFGQNLDPTAALSSSVKPFTPPVLGEGMVGNFRTVASADTGLWLATASSLIILVGLYFHRRAYKPLVDRAAHRDDRDDHERRRDDRQAKESHQNSRSGHPVAANDGRRVVTGRIALAIAALSSVGLVSPMAPADAPANALQNLMDQAADGAVIGIPAGEYFGPIVIDRPMTLIARGRVVIDSGGEGDVIRIMAPDVTLRGFVVRNSGSGVDRDNAGILVLAPRATIENNTVQDTLFGISLQQAPGSVVRGNTVSGKDLDIARRGDGIRLWASSGTVIEHNVVHDVRDVVIWYSDRVQLRGNDVRRSRYGLHFMYSHDNVLEDNHLAHNSVGAFLMYSRNLVVRRNFFAHNRGPSGYGLGLKDMQGVLVEDNHFIANRVGAYLDNPPVYLPDWDRYSRNTFAYNDVGVAFQPSVRRTAAYENSFIENQQQIAIFGGGRLRDNVFTMDGRGNYWSDYRGFDQTGDGIGDLAYQAESFWDNLMDREPNLRLFLFSPAQQAVELAAKAFPIVQPRPLLIDEAPLMRPVVTNGSTPPAQPTWPTWLAAAGLIGVSGLTLAGAHTPTGKDGNS